MSGLKANGGITTGGSRRAQRRFIVAALLAIGLGATALNPVPPPVAAQEPQVTPGVLIVDTLPGEGAAADRHEHGEGVIAVPVPGEAAAALGPNPEPTPIGSGNLIACFGSGVPEQVQGDVSAALDVLDRSLNLKGPPIEIDVAWTPLPSPRSLAAAGPGSFVSDNRLPIPGTRYPIALANELLDVDLSPRSPCGSSRAGEVVLYLNSDAGGDGSLWHLGPEAPGASQIDLRSVALHEVIHGLGFISSASVVGGSTQWPYDNGHPYVYDTKLNRCSKPCLRVSTANSLKPGPNERLVDGDVAFGTTNGSPIDLYVPPVWMTGISLSHVDETIYPFASGLALMTPFVGNGERFEALDPATASILQEIGWPLKLAPAPPQGVVLAGIDQGVVVDALPARVTDGVPPSGYRIEARQVDGDQQRAAPIINVDSLPAELSGLSNGVTYRIEISAQTSGARSASTSGGLVRPGLSSPFVTPETFAQRVLTDWTGRALAADRAALIAALDDGQNLSELIATGPAASDLADDARAIVRLYLGFYQRQPDDDGLAFWIAQSRRGAPLAWIANFFAYAAEFEDRSLSEADFVTVTYERMLGRQPDRSGLLYWTQRLEAGLGRGRMLMRFANTPEHLQRTGAQTEVISTYWAMLGRQPTAEEADTAEDLVRAEGRVALIASILSSGEYLRSLD